MRFLLFGYGSIGRKHATMLREMGHEVVSVDPNHETRADWIWVEDDCALFPRGLAKDVERWEIDLCFDGLMDCTPADVRAINQVWHARWIHAPIFVEKPLGWLCEDVSGSVVMMGFCYYFLPSLRSFVDSLAPHRIYSVTMCAGQDLREWHDGDYRDRYHGTPGRGGVVNDSLPHSLFIARWMLGELDLVGSVTGRFSGLDLRTEDTAVLLLKARDIGVPCTILVDYLRQPRGSTIEVVTSDGVMRWDFDPDEAEEMYRRQMEMFCEVCGGKRAYGFPTLGDGLAVQRILNQVKDAAGCD